MDLQSFLFVPADSSRKLASARKLRADAVIYDLEDAVSADKKVDARDMLKYELDNTPHSSARIFVRVNCFGSSFLDDDLSAAVRPQVYGIVLPKSSDATEVDQIHQRILRLENQNEMPHSGLKLILMLESAKGVSGAAELAKANPRTVALLFGGEDFCADMGIVRTKAGDEIAVARSLVALAAKAERLQAIDGPFTDFKDLAGLTEETRRVMQMGFTGKALIHPIQIDTVHSAMAPSEDEVSWAEEVIRTFEDSGTGVTLVRGKMIDGPIVMQARRVLKRSAINRSSLPS